MRDLFEDSNAGHECQAIGEQAFILRGFALMSVPALLRALEQIERVSAFRHMLTPGGYTMSVAMTNCGRLGWTSDRRGYRYTEIDPLTAQPWPAIPSALRRLAVAASRAAGFAGFEPDACLVNQYVPGARLSLHQDRNERDFTAPIVSLSLGMPAVFLFGSNKRAGKAARVPLQHGDAAVWGGSDRMRYHGVMSLKEQPHPLLGARRINFTVRKAG